MYKNPWTLEKWENVEIASSRSCFPWCQMHTLSCLQICKREFIGLPICEYNCLSTLKHVPLDIFLDRVWNIKTLNEHRTIHLLKVSFPKSILGSCALQWKWHFLPLTKIHWGQCIRLEPAFHFTWMAEHMTRLGLGRCCYKSPCA